jgi:hypothetical protein
LVIGLVVPFLSVIPTVPLLGRLHLSLLGVPLALAWLFACIPLTSVCLAICWFAHDRYMPDEEVATNYGNGEHSNR